MSETANFEQIASDSEVAYGEALSFLGGLPEGLRGEQWYGTWSAREVAIHLGNWLAGQNGCLDLVVRGERPLITIGGVNAMAGETDEVNAAGQSEQAHLDWEGALAYLREAAVRQAELLRAMPGLLPQERLRMEGTAARVGFGGTEHAQHHLATIKEWLQSVAARA